MNRLPLPTILVGALLVLVLLLYGITFQVRFNQEVVKIRLGKADENSVIREPGLYFKWPPPIEVIRTFDRRLHVLDTPDTEVKTRDGVQLLVSCYAVWSIADPRLFYIRANDEKRAEEPLRSRVAEARNTAISQFEMGDLTNLDAQRVEASYEALQQRMLEIAAPKVLEDYGVRLVQVRVRRISLPAETTTAVQQAMIQERQRLATQYREEGKAQAETIKARAESAAKQIAEFTKSKAAEIESAGTQAMTRLYAQIAPEDKDLFLFLRRLEALEASLKNKATIFLDSNSSLFDWFNTADVNPGGEPGAPPAATQPSRRPRGESREGGAP